MSTALSKVFKNNFYLMKNFKSQKISQMTSFIIDDLKIVGSIFEDTLHKYKSEFVPDQ